MKAKIIKSTLLLFLFIVSLTIRSQSLVVWKHDGTNIRILFEDRPRTMFTEESLRIETSKASIEIPLEQVKKYTYELDADIINQPPSSPAISYKGDKLFISGLTGGTKISVYSIDGRMLYEQSPNQRGETSILLTNLPKGVYLFKIGSLVTYKYYSK